MYAKFKIQFRKSFCSKLFLSCSKKKCKKIVAFEFFSDIHKRPLPTSIHDKKFVQIQQWEVSKIII